MASNNYDDVALERARMFADGRSRHHAFVEKPAMFSLLPEVKGKRVLSLGCGTGEECRELVNRGATVHGIDLSRVSVDYARRHVEGATFQVMDMDRELSSVLHAGSYDLVYSSLVLHHSKDIAQLLGQIHQVLKPRGYFLFSVCHPVKWAAEAYRHPEDDNKKSFLLGYEKDGENLRIYGDYFQRTRMKQHYPTGLDVDYQALPPSSYFKFLTSQGFEILDFTEPSAIDAAKEVDPAFWQLTHRIPQWMVFLARRRDQDAPSHRGRE